MTIRKTDNTKRIFKDSSQQVIIFFLLLCSLFQSSNSSAQRNNTIPFDTCEIYTTSHPDSLMLHTSRFVGHGSIDLYRDSILINFQNEWECGKYLIHLYDTQGRIWRDDFIWYYYGREYHRGWDCLVMVVLDKADKIIRFELLTDFLDDDGAFPGKSRFYIISENNTLKCKK